MNFSIITPSFRNSRWLKLCIASVADQQGVKWEHIVQDSCSDDGTQDWLPRDPRVKAFIEKDGGMYDAVNRGYRRAAGDILAYLNCDEQYLPGALKTVSDFFEANPKIEAAITHTLVTDGDGKYICHSHSLVPHPHHAWFRFRALTCSIFIRRKIIFERGIFFDPRWHDLGDFHLEFVASRSTLIGAHLPGDDQGGLLRQAFERVPQLGRDLAFDHHALHQAGAVADDGEEQFAALPQVVEPAANGDRLAFMTAELRDSSNWSLHR